jgi:polysaccharide export outer membrane protein
MLPFRTKFMRRPSIWVCLALAAMLQGCACEPRPPMEYRTAANLPYTLAPGDCLRVIVFGQDSLSNSYAVDTAGRIAMPLIGPVPANGRTTTQLARAIEARLRDGYIRDPRVTVEVEAYRPFFVTGEVINSGQYPYVIGMNVEAAVAIAGGYTLHARKDQAELTRTEQGRTVTVDVPVTEPVKPGDTIIVHEGFFPFF